MSRPPPDIRHKQFISGCLHLGWLLGGGRKGKHLKGKNSNSLEGELQPRGAGFHIQFGDGGMFIGGVKRRGWCVCMWMGRGVLFTPTSSIIFTILPLGEPTGLLIMSLDPSHTHTHVHTRTRFSQHLKVGQNSEFWMTGRGIAREIQQLLNLFCSPGFAPFWLIIPSYFLIYRMKLFWTN